MIMIITYANFSLFYFISLIFSIQGPALAFKSVLKINGEDYILVKSAGDGSCLPNSAFCSPIVLDLCRDKFSSTINNGYDLRLAVIQHMMGNYGREFRWLCSRMIERHKVAVPGLPYSGFHLQRSNVKLLNDADLNNYVETKLENKEYFLSTEFAVMMTYCLGAEFILIGNTLPNHFAKDRPTS